MGQNFKATVEKILEDHQYSPAETASYQQIQDLIEGIKEAADRVGGLYSMKAPLNMSANVLKTLTSCHAALANIAEHVDTF